MYKICLVIDFLLLLFCFASKECVVKFYPRQPRRLSAAQGLGLVRERTVFIKVQTWSFLEAKSCGKGFYCVSYGHMGERN